MPLPNFLIVGETKCGTTSMYDNLVQHPDVLTTRGNGEKVRTEDGDLLGIKEIRFFDRYFWKGIDWYKSCFPKCPDGFITGEASPTYLYRTQALGRIASVLPDCKIIVMLRDPADRLVSHYNHLVRIHRSSGVGTRYQTLWDFWNGAQESDYYIIDKGIYWRSIDNLYKHFNRSNVMVIRSETMFEEPQRIYSETLKFLGVNDAKLFEPSHSRKGTKKEIDESLMREIRRFYNPHNMILAEMLGESWW